MSANLSCKVPLLARMVSTIAGSGARPVAPPAEPDFRVEIAQDQECLHVRITRGSRQHLIGLTPGEARALSLELLRKAGVAESVVRLRNPRQA